MEKEASSRKTKKSIKPVPDCLKLMAVTWKKKPLVGNQKNPSKPDPDGLKPKAVKWQKKHQVGKTTTTKKHESLNPTALNQRQ